MEAERKGSCLERNIQSDGNCTVRKEWNGWRKLTQARDAQLYSTADTDTNYLKSSLNWSRMTRGNLPNRPVFTSKQWCIQICTKCYPSRIPVDSKNGNSAAQPRPDKNHFRGFRLILILALMTYLFLRSDCFSFVIQYKNGEMLLCKTIIILLLLS